MRDRVDLKGAGIMFSRTQSSRLGVFTTIVAIVLFFYFRSVWPVVLIFAFTMVFYLTKGVLSVFLLKKDGKRFIVVSYGILKGKKLIFPLEAFFTTEIVSIPFLRYKKWSISKGEFNGKPVTYIAGNSKEGILAVIRPDYAVLDSTRILIAVRDPAAIVKNIWG